MRAATVSEAIEEETEEGERVGMGRQRVAVGAGGDLLPAYGGCETMPRRWIAYERVNGASRPRHPTSTANEERASSSNPLCPTLLRLLG